MGVMNNPSWGVWRKPYHSEYKSWRSGQSRTAILPTFPLDVQFVLYVLRWNALNSQGNLAFIGKNGIENFQKNWQTRNACEMTWRGILSRTISWVWPATMGMFTLKRRKTINGCYIQQNDTILEYGSNLKTEITVFGPLSQLPFLGTPPKMAKKTVEQLDQFSYVFLQRDEHPDLQLRRCTDCCSERPLHRRRSPLCGERRRSKTCALQTQRAKWSGWTNEGRALPSSP